MIIRNNQTREHKNSEQCTVWEYDFPSESLSHAVCLITGRYPDQGKAMNTECDELFFVLSGTGTLHTENETTELATGDAYYLRKQEAYWITGQELKLTLTNAPAWKPEQHKHVP